MKNITRLLFLLLLITAVFIPSTASASGFKDDKVVFGDNFTLESGETLDGDLIVLGGNLILEASSTVNGDTVVFGGNVTTNGTINGNLVALGGFVELQELTQINGDLSVLGSSYEQADGAVINGNIITEEQIPFEFNLPSRIASFDRNFPAINFGRLPFISASWFFFRILIWTGLAILLTLFLQNQPTIITQAAFKQPVISLLVGLGVILLPVALFITIILIPISILSIFALIAAGVFGLVSLSIEVGRKLANALDQSLPVPIMAGLGMFIITLIFNGFSQIVPCVGWLPKFVLVMWMMGAAILTRFGTQEHPVSDISETGIKSTQLPEAFESEEEETKEDQPKE
jgi:cytoskeletal protein CcmA (bactofilin family)